MASTRSGFAIWFVGLPGSGKSTVAKGIRDFLVSEGYDVVLLEMDQRRKVYYPQPEYTAQEREQAYALFVDETCHWVDQGKAVLMDGSAYKLSMRAYARKLIPRFAEVFIHCELEEAMRREGRRPEGKVMADLYAKALKRKKTGRQVEGLGEVIGVDVPFEVDTEAELIVDSTHMTKYEVLGKVLHFVESWLDGE